MSADRELLELAAKAAGLVNPQYEQAVAGNWNIYHGDLEDPRECWNPLTDDGDRYRLARQLGINIDFSDCCAWKRMPSGNLIQEFWGGDCGDEAHAVLRVAAEIGKTMDGGNEG